MSAANYLSLADLTAAQEEDVTEYKFPCDDTKTVRVKSVTVSRMKQYTESAKKGGLVEKRAQCALIAESCVGLDNKPIWSVEELYNAVSAMKTRWFNSLVKLVAAHNGAEDEVEEVDQTEKN